MENKLKMELLWLILLFLFLVVAATIYSAYNNKLENHDYEFTNIKQLTDLSISGTSGKVEVTAYDGDSVKVSTTSYKGREMIAKVENGTLRIFEKNKISFMSFGFYNDSEIKVQLPRKLILNHDYKITSGSLIMENMDLKTLNIRLTSGKIALNRLKTNHVIAKLSSGKIELDHIKTNDLDISVTSGRIYYNGTADKINIRTTSGTCELDLDNVPTRMKAKATSGKILIHIPDNDGFRLYKKVTSGTFKSDFELYNRNDEYIYKDPKRNYEIKMTSGLIKLYKK